MRYWGKLLGVILAIWAGGGFWAVVLGLLIGHMVDKARGARVTGPGYFSDQQTRQNVFFRTTFQVMGHLTKSKGRVTEADIVNANRLMTRMQLNDALKSAAKGKIAISRCAAGCVSSARSALAVSILFACFWKFRSRRLSPMARCIPTNGRCYTLSLKSWASAVASLTSFSA